MDGPSSLSVDLVEVYNKYSLRKTEALMTTRTIGNIENKRRVAKQIQHQKENSRETRALDLEANRIMTTVQDPKQKEEALKALKEKYKAAGESRVTHLRDELKELDEKVIVGLQLAGQEHTRILEQRYQTVNVEQENDHFYRASKLNSPFARMQTEFEGVLAKVNPATILGSMAA